MVFLEPNLKDLREFQIPDCFILSPEQLMKYEDFTEKETHWFYLLDLIRNNIRGASKSYMNNLPLATIFYSILALEFSLKIKWCRYLAESKSDEDADNFLKERGSTLGNFCKDDTKLNTLNLIKIKDQVQMINNLRSGLFHFNWEKYRDGVCFFNKELIETIEKISKGKGGAIIYPNLLGNKMASKVFNLVTELMEVIFLPKKSTKPESF